MRVRSAGALLAMLMAGPATADGDEQVARMLNMSLDELLDVRISVASRTEASLFDAPSVVTLITDEDIRRSGARDLRDALRLVPGFEPGVRVFGYPEFGLRGVITENTEKVLILLDGLAVNEHLEGSGTIVFGDFPLDNIERIEIIRGPGSALYGTNAFVGVISLVSKPAPATPVVLSAAAGSFATRSASLRTGWQRGDWQLSTFLHFLDSDGDRQPVAVDALQQRENAPWFSPINADVSLAGGPRGHTDNERRKWTGQLRLSGGDFAFNALAIDARKGPYVGTLFTLTEESEAHPYQLQADASYGWQLGDSARLEARLHGRHYVADNLWNSMPPGYRVPDGDGGFITYTRGQFDRQGATQQTFGGELKSTWTLGSRHTVIGGLSYEEQSLYDIVNQTNVPGFGPERMVDAAPIIIGEPDRQLTTLYLQDQWQALDTLALTSGLRMDRYSDAGTSVTPRLAAVWRPAEQLSLKAMYGEGFRAPTFVESYLFAFGGFARGNIANEPETIRTGELVAIYRFGAQTLLQVNLFQSRIDNLLQLLPTSEGFLEYRNQSELTVVRGIESELRVDFGERLSGQLSYSNQDGENEATGQPLLGMARWQARLGLNYAFNERLNLHAELHAVGDRERNGFDSRAPLDGYHTVDVALWHALTEQFELSLTGHNLFDADQRFPDLSAGLRDDFPWEGRALSLQLTWRPQ